MNAPRWIALVAAVVVTGCSPRQKTAGHAAHDLGHDEETHAEVAATYKAGHGVRLAETAVRFVGLRLGEVETRALSFGAETMAAVPREAVLRTVRGDFVYVENGGWLLRSPVTIGESVDGWTAIQDGLYEGDRVAVSGVDALWMAEIAAVNGGVGCADGH